MNEESSQDPDWRLLMQAALRGSDAPAVGFESVYDELRALARSFLRRERRDHTLPATALVHEAWCRLHEKLGRNLRGREEIVAAFASELRRTLIDHARRRGAEKRGGARVRTVLESAEPTISATMTDVVVLGDVLEGLAREDPVYARVVELRVFLGLTRDETQRILGLSKRQFESRWRFAKAWIALQLEGSRSASTTVAAADQEPG